VLPDFSTPHEWSLAKLWLPTLYLIASVGVSVSALYWVFRRPKP
jgi:hypothetical protein